VVFRVLKGCEIKFIFNHYTGEPHRYLWKCKQNSIIFFVRCVFHQTLPFRCFSGRVGYAWQQWKYSAEILASPKIFDSNCCRHILTLLWFELKIGTKKLSIEILRSLTIVLFQSNWLKLIVYLFVHNLDPLNLYSEIWHLNFFNCSIKFLNTS